MSVRDAEQWTSGCKKEGQSDPLPSIILDRRFNDVTWTEGPYRDCSDMILFVGGLS